MRKIKLLQKTFSLLTSLSLLFQSCFGFLTTYNFAYAQDESTPTPTVVQEQVSEPTPTPVEPTPTIGEPTPTPEPTPTEEPAFTPTPEPEATLTPTISEPPPTPTIEAKEPQEEGKLSATIVDNVSATSVNELDLDAQVVEESASLVTDKADYAPTDTALITGTSFKPNTEYLLVISSQDDPPVTDETKIITDETGSFVYAYQLDGTYRPNYKVEAKRLSGELITEASFTDSSEDCHLSGAIWTTDLSCNTVNENQFDAKQDVYLNGGPHNGSGSGLPAGNYYIRITEPNGTVLGQSETAVISVGEDGNFSQCYPVYFNVKNNGVEGYADTSNPGGEYRVLISADPSFPPNCSNSDNFKVIASPTPGPNCGNGVLDSGEECDFGDRNGANSACSTSCELRVPTPYCEIESQLQTFNDRVDIDGSNDGDNNLVGWRPAKGSPSDSTYNNWDGNEAIGMVVGPGADECSDPQNSTAGFTFGQAGEYITSLSVRALDGISGTDSFDILLNGQFLAHYSDNE